LLLVSEKERLIMQSKMIKVTDKNRTVITESYVSRVLDDMDYDTLYSFAYCFLKDSKSELTNDQLTNQISDYYPDLLEDS
jgi:hypothetical protein